MITSVILGESCAYERGRLDGVMFYIKTIAKVISAEYSNEKLSERSKEPLAV